MVDRPYFNELTATLAEKADRDWRKPKALHLLYEELLHRERRSARQLRALIEERLQDFKSYFPWPTTHAPDSSEALDEDVFRVKVGLLRFMGYQVGQDGVSPQKRRALLEDVYLRQVPPVSSAKYMAEWGKPRTSARLKKLANTIAANVRNARRRTDAGSRAKAIQEWEADLAYMKRKFYDGVYSFQWPKTAA